MEEQWIARAKSTCDEIASNFSGLGEIAPWMAVAAGLIIGALEGSNKVMFCGNGGSAATSQHLAAALTGKHLVDRKPLAAMALTADGASLTAIGNEYDFDEAFARQLRGIGRQGDVLFAISTSGSSANVVEAARVAREMGIKVVAMTGHDGGALSGYADSTIKVPATRPDRIQEMQIAAGHMICEIIEEVMAR